jgi:hypothetical protein
VLNDAYGTMMAIKSFACWPNIPPERVQLRNFVEPHFMRDFLGAKLCLHCFYDSGGRSAGRARFINTNVTVNDAGQDVSHRAL